LVTIGIWPTRCKISAACANVTKPLNQTAALATCSLQCVSHKRSWLSRGKKTCATGRTIVVAAFEGQCPDPAFDCVGFDILVMHLALAGRTPRAGTGPLAVLRLDHRQRHLFA